MVNFKYGHVCDRDAPNCRVRVEFPEDGIVSHWLPILLPGARGNKYFHMPDINDHVVCLLDCNLETGVVIGSIYDQNNKPGFGSNDVAQVNFSDGAQVGYDRAGHKLTAIVQGLKIEVGPNGLEITKGGKSLKAILEGIVNANIAETHNVTAVGSPSGPPINVLDFSNLLADIQILFS